MLCWLQTLASQECKPSVCGAASNEALISSPYGYEKMLTNLPKTLYGDPQSQIRSNRKNA